MTGIFLLFTMAALLQACAITYEKTRQPENATIFHLDADYQKAYRIIDNALKECMPPSQINSVLYPDQNKATITKEAENIVGMSLDLEQDSAGGTKGTYYSYFKTHNAKTTGLLKAWVDGGKKGCYPDKLVDRVKF